MPYHPRLFCAAVLLFALGVPPGETLIGMLTVECRAARAVLSATEMSRIWREEFPLPQSSAASTRVPNVGLAPPALGTTHAASRAGVQWRSDRPHPAVARIIVPEAGATSFGSGTLIDVRDRFGMVITNWHVVRDATGTIEVVFPGGFTSKARALKVDADWDLAALVIWQPPVEPVTIAVAAPRPGDRLTICGYGQGNYRCATGRCTQFLAPRVDFPRHMVELDVEARQGDSGGPIFNQQGELAGVLFGAGQGTTLGSFGGRVGTFLATLAPDIGRATEALAANQQEPSWAGDAAAAREDGLTTDSESRRVQPHATDRAVELAALSSGHAVTPPPAEPSPSRPVSSAEPAAVWPSASTTALHPDADNYPRSAVAWQPTRQDNLFEQMKTVLAVVGLLAIVVQVLRVAR